MKFQAIFEIFRDGLHVFMGINEALLTMKRYTAATVTEQRLGRVPGRVKHFGRKERVRGLAASGIGSGGGGGAAVAGGAASWGAGLGG